MDLLCSLLYKCKYLCDSVHHIQHWQHNCMDQHISHFDRLVLLDILDQSGIHMGYILCMDYLYVLEDIDT